MAHQQSRTLAIETLDKVGQEVTLSGWVASSRDHGGLIFIDLRDHTGIVQLTINPDAGSVFDIANSLRDEFVVQIKGIVKNRDAGLVNPNIPTGSVEVVVSEITVLNKSKALPFQINHATDEVNEEIRLKYRFLDLRRDKMQSMLKRRHLMIKMIRDYMDEHEFIEINTPILANSSPEGARDFLVPSRLHPGKFYALPQAPQQFKQLLMVGGVPKYFQIAPCFRDEDPRADRSPGEFYQLDLEIAFADTSEIVFQELEPLFVKLTKEFANKKLKDEIFPRIPFKEAMEKYGSDRPDLRYGMELTELTEYLQNTEFTVFANAIKNGGCVKAICLEGGATMSRGQIDELTEIAKKEGAGGLAYITYSDEGPKSPIAKFMSETEMAAIQSTMGAKTGDIVFFGADDRAIVNKVLGKLRDVLGDKFNLKDPNVVAWAWITDFPLYEYDAKEKKIDFMHNPFSMPKGGLEALETQDPLEILADQYDIIANGLELSSGAIRNFNPDIMYKAFNIVGINKETVDSKFGAMIRAFEFGAPPSGGFAPGIDRMLMLFENEPNIREVIAFPKNGSAQDVMMNAPSTVDDYQLKELSIKLDLPEEKK